MNEKQNTTSNTPDSNEAPPTSLVKDGGGLAPEWLTKRVCKDGFIDCGYHSKSESRQVKYIREDLTSRASVAAVQGDELVNRQDVLNAVMAFCAQYDSLGERFKKLLRISIRAIPAAASSPAPAEPAQPHIGALIDGWEGLPNDLKTALREDAPSFVKAIMAIYDATTETAAPQPEGNHLQLLRMCLQQFEFTYGQRKRGWDAKYLMDRLREATEPAAVPPTTPSDAAMRAAEFEYCPTCAGELDTGFECTQCGRDWRPWATERLVDEVQRRMDQVVETAVEWHQAGREGGEWFDAAEKLSAAIDSLLELRDKPVAATECFCGTELEAGLCPNGHDPIATRTTTQVSWKCPKCGWRKVQAVACGHCHAWCESSTTTATTSPETAVGGEAEKCVKCGHDDGTDPRGRCVAVLRDAGSSLVYCDCKCEFAAPVPAAGDDEGDPR